LWPEMSSISSGVRPIHQLGGSTLVTTGASGDGAAWGRAGPGGAADSNATISTMVDATIRATGRTRRDKQGRRM